MTPKADYLRVLMGELCRITSHHTWFAACGLDLGALTPFLYAFSTASASSTSSRRSPAAA